MLGKRRRPMGCSGNLSKVTPFFYLLPSLFIFIIFVFVPFLQTIFYSFCKWDTPSHYVFAGFANYAKLSRDDAFIFSIKHNLIWLGITFAFPFLISLILSYILMDMKGSLSLSLIYFIPSILPPAAAGAMWLLIYAPHIGVLNYFLRLLGLEGWTWLGAETGLYALSVLFGWSFFGFCTLIIYNATGSINRAIIEAAKIDGASGFKLFRNVIVPSLKKPILFTSIFAAITAMNTFDVIYITTRGGPGYATELMATYIYRLVFMINDFGTAAAVSVVLGLASISLTAILVREFWR